MMETVRLLCLGGLAIWVAPAIAGEGSIDARFDRTGDGLVDQRDWPLLDGSQQRDYAYLSLQALGQDPYARSGDEIAGERYLSGLRAAYAQWLK